MASADDRSTTDHAHHHDGSIKETIISLLIAFVMALVFRSYVIEAFVIPTGSMAPTLLGAHMHFKSRQSGFEWDVNPWNMLGEAPFPVQGDRRDPRNMAVPVVTDPMSTTMVDGRHGWAEGGTPKKLGAGDRILVQKYLYNLFPPERYDVIVFKNPERATQNYIKRLVGLPNEQVWIADGDVFARPITRDPDGTVDVRGDWAIQRKPVRIQRRLWRPLFSSEFAPIDPVRDQRRWFHCPWQGRAWETGDRRDYRTESAEPTELEWDVASWPIDDFNWYNDFPLSRDRTPRFKVADLRIRAGVRPDDASLSMAATIGGAGHDFRVRVADATATIEMRAIDPATDTPGPWTALAQGHAPPFVAGRVTDVEFWHYDQSLSLWMDGRRVLEATYDWSPDERLLYATGRRGEDYTSLRAGRDGLDNPRTYRLSNPSARFSFSGSALTLHRVGLDRDLYYRAVQRSAGRPGLGTHPFALATLGPREYFMLGDNSSNSKDARRWDTIDPVYARQMFGVEYEGKTDREIARAIEPHLGIVPREMILGKAFFVYFPAPKSFARRLPVPDAGRLRFIF